MLELDWDAVIVLVILTGHIFISLGRTVIIVKVLTRPLSTGGERVSNKTLRTATDRIVSHDITSSVDTTHSNTGVRTLQVDTGQGGGTLADDNALRATPGRSSEIS